MRGRKTYEVGQRINGFVLKEKLTKTEWYCLCDCGNYFQHSTKHMLRRKSCGCKSKSNRYAQQFDRLQTIWQCRYRYYKQNANRRKIPFELNVADIQKLLLGECTYCGQLPHSLISYARNARDLDDIKDLRISGIDRFDNNVGYQVENCVSCCQKCNAAKSTMNLQEFKQHIERIHLRINICA